MSRPATIRRLTLADPASVTNTGGGAYTGPKACRQLKPSVSGPESNSTSVTSPPISRLNALAGFSRIGKVKPDFSASPSSAARPVPPKIGLPAASGFSFLPFRSLFTSLADLALTVLYILSAVVGELLVSSALSPAISKSPSGT